MRFQNGCLQAGLILFATKTFPIEGLGDERGIAGGVVSRSSINKFRHLDRAVLEAIERQTMDLANALGYKY